MDKGTLARWVRVKGDTVKVGDVLAEVETDKAVMELAAVTEGVLETIVIPQGTSEIAGGTVLALMAGPADPPGQADGSPQLSTDNVPRFLERGNRIFASPRARRLAKEVGVELEGIRGSGPQCRIIERDIAAARPLISTAPLGTTSETPKRATMRSARSDLPGSASQDLLSTSSYVEVPHDPMRKTIARRLSESKQSVPHFYLSVDCEMDALLTLKEQLADAMGVAEGFSGRKLSINDFLIRAWAMAVARMPEVNVSWTDNAMLKHRNVDVGVAVAIPGGVIAPVVRCADKKTLSDISDEMKDLAARAAARSLTADEYAGGTTAISNLGMYGVHNFVAIVNPPHSTILAVGAAEKRVVAKDDSVAIKTVMSCTLSVDHRAIDGATAARVLAEFRRFVQNPIVMCV